MIEHICLIALDIVCGAVGGAVTVAFLGWLCGDRQAIALLRQQVDLLKRRPDPRLPMDTQNGRTGKP